MRKSLKEIESRIQYIDTDNLYEAVNQIKTILDLMLEQIDQALPKEVDMD